jgi:hypothetical protein
MPQNLISLQLSDADVNTLNTLMGDMESRLTGLLALDNATRRQLTKMGDKSEAFVRQTIMVLAQNPEIVPPSLGLAEAQADLRALDQLRPLLARMQRLVERMSDSEMALGSDAMTVALEGYGLLKLSGRNKGLEAVSEALSARFSRSRKAEAAPAA